MGRYSLRWYERWQRRQERLSQRDYTKMEIPNYKNFEYDLTDEEKELFKGETDWNIKDKMYIRSLPDELLRAANRTKPYRGGGTGIFVKLKKKMKMGDYLDPLILNRLLIEEMFRRGFMAEVTYNIEIERLKEAEIIKYT
jgi:hypothetical protein